MVTTSFPLAGVVPEEDATARLAALFTAHFEFVWRSLRRLGVPAATIDDAAQEVFVVASRRLLAIVPGKEKAFLFGTALRIAAGVRRADRRRPDVLDETIATNLPPIDELVDRKRALELLDAIIASFPDDIRAVFVLFELEGMTMAEIAGCLGLRPGTVASRLRRAREHFRAVVARLEARRNHG
jgi:RNA polymerase sigma-70 factor (ECF subfamily)